MNTAKDKGSGKEQSITITGASTLPNDEVERLNECFSSYLSCRDLKNSIFS